MKKVLNEYKETIKYFLSDKRYIISVIIVAILSYGFTITHYSIGIDDLCFDRYVHGTYILSAKRWGTWLLYNVLQINEFTPFWLDTVVAIFMVVVAIILSTFLKKHLGDKIKMWGYILFSSLLISNPLINHFFIYQSTNLAIVISNLTVIICAIIIFENYFKENKKIINIVCGLILTIPIAMYESCAQTYIVLLFVTVFIKLIQNKTPNKKLYKYFCLSISMLILGIVLYFIIGNVLVFFLDKFNILQTNHAYTGSMWQVEKFRLMSIGEKLSAINEKFMQDFSIYYLPVATFMGFSFITILLEVIKLIKTSKVLRIVSVLGIILSNFILIFMLLVILFRTQFSWIITTAFLGLYLYQSLCNKKVIGILLKIGAVFLIVIQTRTLNQYFYNEYKRYEKEKAIANDIAMNVMKTCDYKDKPIICIYTKQNGDKYRINRDNGNSLINWGITAFNEKQTELTKFINEQGYSFKYITKEQEEKAIKQLAKMPEEEIYKYIIELDDAIIVNLDYYEY